MAYATATRQGEEKRQRKRNNTTVPLSLLLPEYVAEHWVIFITNEINNAAIYPQLCPGGLHRLREMRILICSSKAIARKAVQRKQATHEQVQMNVKQVHAQKQLYMHMTVHSYVQIIM